MFGFCETALAVLLPADTGSGMPWWLYPIIAHVGLTALMTMVLVAVMVGQWARRSATPRILAVRRSARRRHHH
jgi:hypothetical protein